MQDSNMTPIQFNYMSDEYYFYQGENFIGKISSPLTSEGIYISDAIQEIDRGFYKWSRTITNKSINEETIRLSLDFIANYKSEYYMVPAVSYNGNPWGRGNEPKGLMKDGKPWTFAYHRAAIPGATFSKGEKFAVAVFGECSPDIPGFSCELLQTDKETVHRLVYPEEEGPLSYTDRDKYTEGYAEQLTIEPGQKSVINAYIVITPTIGETVPYAYFLDCAWKLNKRDILNKYKCEEVWKLGMEFTHSLWCEEESFRGFSIGLLWSGEGWYRKDHWKYEIGWCGQNASLATSLLYDYLIHHRKESLERGLECLDSWVDHARLDNGLVRCHFDFLLSEKVAKPEIQDACNLGNAADNLFEAYELAGKCGYEKKAYLETAFGICDFAVRAQDEAGCFSKAWNNDGSCVEREGGTGGILVPPLLKAYSISNKEVYLASAQKAFHFYFSILDHNGFTTAGALDTYCIDKESAIPLLKSALLLYKATGEKCYLNKAEHVAYYLSTWQWHYSTEFPAGSPLQEIGYDTFGGTAVSVQHHHIDPFALCYVNDLLLLSELLQKDIWTERAMAVWANGLNGVSDGTLEIASVKRPAGGQDEGFYHTRWKEQNDVSNWLVAWPTAFRLETLRKLARWEKF